MTITADIVADLDPHNPEHVTKVRLSAEREGGGMITVPFPHCHDEIVDKANFLTMTEQLAAAVAGSRDIDGTDYVSGWEPEGYRMGWLTFPATGPAVSEYITMVSYILRVYPILDDDLHSELEFADAEDQWHAWGRSDAFKEVTTAFDVDGFVDDMAALLETDAGIDIATDIESAGTDGFTEYGYGESLSWDAAAEAMADRVVAWHRLARWNIETCNGSQLVFLTITNKGNE